MPNTAVLGKVSFAASRTHLRALVVASGGSERYARQTVRPSGRQTVRPSGRGSAAQQARHLQTTPPYSQPRRVRLPELPAHLCRMALGSSIAAGRIAA